MKIKLTLISVLLIIGINLTAQEYIIRVKEQGTKKHSYINEKGETISEKVYFAATDFCEQGVAVIALNSNLAYKIINTQEEVIETDIPLKPIVNEWTQQISGFRSGMLRTKFKERIGALDTEGKLRIPAVYEKMTEFYGNHAIGLSDNKYFVIHKNGDITELKFEKIKHFKHFSDGLAPIRIKKKWGYVDTLGNMAIEPRFKSVGYFNGGIAWAKDLNGLVGYINQNGEWIIEPYYSIGMDYDESSGLARVKHNMGWGYINMEKEFSKLGITNTFHNFYEGLAVKHGRGRVGFIDHTGEWVIEPVYNAVHRFRNGFAKAELNGCWGIIDKEGKWLVEHKYKEIGNAVKIK